MATDYSEYLEEGGYGDFLSRGNYSDYLAKGNYSEYLPTSNFDADKWGNYSNTTALTQEILNRATGVEEELEQISDEEEFEKWWRENSGEPGTHDAKPFEGIERTRENNFGYIDKPALMSLAGLLPGVAGLIGTGINLGINASNIGAINAARAELGLPSLTTAEIAKTGILGTNGVIGTVTVDGKEVQVSLSDKNVDNEKTLNFDTAKDFVDAEREASVSAAPGILGTADVAQGPMTSSPAGGARAASDLGTTGWGVPSDISVPTPTPEAQVEPRTTGLDNLTPSSPVLGMGSGRSVAPSDQILSIADNAVKSVLGQDWTISVTSGTYTPEQQARIDAVERSLAERGISQTSKRGQDELEAAGRIGSDRHNHGRAVDFGIVNPTTGQTLTRANTPEETFRTIEQEMAARGAKGIGFGRGYMEKDGTARYHVDTVRDNTWAADAAKIAEAKEFGRTLGALPAHDNRAELPSPTSRDAALAQIEAQNAPPGRGLIDSPELPSNAVGARDIVQDDLISEVPENITAQGFLSTPETLDPSIDQSRFGTTETPSVLSPDINEDRFGYPAPEVLSNEIYGQPEVRNTDINIGTATPAEAAAKGLIERSDVDKGLIAFTLAGELSGKTLADLNSPDARTREEARTELANMITTVENRVGSGKYGSSVKDTLAPSQYNSLSKSALSTTVDNFNKYAEELVGLVNSYYDPNGIVPTNYGLTHYHANYVTPGWSGKMADREAVGRHTFGVLDGKYDVPVTDSFREGLIESQLNAFGTNIATPTSRDSALVDVAEDEQSIQSLEQSMNDQSFMGPNITDAIDVSTPSVDSGREFGMSFGSGFGSQTNAGATSQNALGGVDDARDAEDSFGGFSAGVLGEDPGMLGNMEGTSNTLGFGGNSEGEGRESVGTVSAQSMTTGDFSIGPAYGEGDGYSSSSSSSSGSDYSGSSDDGGFMGSLSDAFSDAFSGDSSSSSSSSESSSTSSSDDGDND